MPIGRFARACRLSVKALRHYDEEELLRPAHVDERTGYRYYTREQVRDAVTIGMLRGLGIGIPIIRQFLAGGTAERSAILHAEATRIEREMAHRRSRLRTRRVAGARSAASANQRGAGWRVRSRHACGSV